MKKILILLMLIGSLLLGEYAVQTNDNFTVVKTGDLVIAQPKLGGLDLKDSRSKVGEECLPDKLECVNNARCQSYYMGTTKYKCMCNSGFEEYNGYCLEPCKDNFIRDPKDGICKNACGDELNPCQKEEMCNENIIENLVICVENNNDVSSKEGGVLICDDSNLGGICHFFQESVNLNDLYFTPKSLKPIKGTLNRGTNDGWEVYVPMGYNGNFINTNILHGLTKRLSQSWDFMKQQNIYFNFQLT